MSQGMKSQQFQYSNYSPTEFEQFRNAVQMDGFTVTQNTIDTVSGHIGSLTYLTGNYNRNQQVLTVTVKTSPWQSFQDGHLEDNVKRVVARDEQAAAKVNEQAVKTPVDKQLQPLGTNKNIVQPAIPPKPATPAVLQPAQTPKPAQATTPATTPVKDAPTTPTESK